jgi:GT2 family glycosyltransferase
MANGDKKHGRNKNRPAQKTYTLAKRWVTNKAKAIKRHTRCMAKKAIRRIEWEIRKGKTTLQANAERLQELRHVVSQNRTG